MITQYVQEFTLAGVSSIWICYDGLHSLHGQKVTLSNCKTCPINTGYHSIAQVQEMRRMAQPRLRWNLMLQH